MAKLVTAATPDPDRKKCTKHNIPLKYSKKEKTWYCPECLQAAYNSWKAQQEAVKRYRDTNKGKEAQGRYEKSEKGKTARERYLKSPKYKQRRKEHNQRVQESLQIARMAITGKPKPFKKPAEIPADASPLLHDILEYMELISRSPSTADVKEWADDLYQKRISTAEAQKLIDQAKELASG